MAAKNLAAQRAKDRPGSKSSANSGKKFEATTIEEKHKNKSSKFKFILLFVSIFLLGAMGFAAGVYLKFIDYQQLVNQYELTKLPIIGQFLPTVETNFEQVDLNSNSTVQPGPGNSLTQPIAPQTNGLAPVSPNIPPSLQAQDIQQQAKKKQQEENKKFAKLARLYGAMAPDEAAKILQQFDNQTVMEILNRMEEDQAAKVLAQFDAGRAAEISKTLLTKASIQ